MLLTELSGLMKFIGQNVTYIDDVGYICRNRDGSGLFVEPVLNLVEHKICANRRLCFSRCKIGTNYGIIPMYDILSN